MPARRPARRSRRARLLLAGLALGAPAARGAEAQKVALRIRPQVGDTIHMRMDQVTEMTGTVRDGDSTATRRSATRVIARAIVRKVDAGGAVVVAVTDSVTAEGRGSRPAQERLRRAMVGRPMTLRVAADGSMDIEEDGSAAAATPELRGLFASMPPTLPREPVAVGATWHRTIPVPTAAAGSLRAAGMLRAVFTLDSTSRGGEVAFISMRASLEQEVPHDRLPPGARMTSTSVITGTMQVDRKRGWMTDSRTTVSVHSVATPPPGSKDLPVQFRMKITQWLRAVDKP